MSGINLFFARSVALACLGWLVVTAAAASGAARTAPLPAQSFVGSPAIDRVVISPSGKHLAMVVRSDNGRLVLATMELPRAGPPRVIAGFSNADVRAVFWVNDDRLVYQGYEDGFYVADGGGGTFAINHDGSGMQPLIVWSRVVTGGRWQSVQLHNRVLPYGWHVMGPVGDGSAEVLAVHMSEHADRSQYITDVVHLDTVSGNTRSQRLGMPPQPSSLVFDAQGLARVVSVFTGGRHRVLVRQQRGSHWEQLLNLPLFDPAAWTPIALEGEDQLLVYGNQGRDTAGYYLYDLKKRRLDTEPLVAVNRFDIGGLAQDRRSRRAMGVSLMADRPMSVWFDQRLDGIQKSVDAALPPGRFNTLSCSRCETTQQFVVLSESDRHPGEFYLYDHAARKLEPLGSRRPEIDEASQGRRSFHWVKARDGLEMPVVVTHPAGSQADEKLPAVLLVHGGPWVRGADVRWHAEAQFLASRGYRVLQPDFRGSTGLGYRHFQAGFKQWGLAMQDDLADTVAWAADQGLVDADRVCIYGGSYGGYAALMGPIRHPGVYRCAISYAGVTDIGLHFSTLRSDMGPQTRRYSLPQLVGDPVADREQFERTSPLKRVAEIKVPVLLAHGADDIRVTREHADQFVRAARAAGVRIENVSYGRDGHGWNFVENHLDFLTRMEQFLSRTLSSEKR